MLAKNGASSKVLGCILPIQKPAARYKAAVKIDIITRGNESITIKLRMAAPTPINKGCISVRT